MIIRRDLAQALGEAQTRLLRKRISHWARIWTVPSLPTLVEIRPNIRLRSVVARYRRDTRTIEVGARFLSLRKRRTEVLAHEMAHAAVDLKHGRVVRTHGKEWQALVIAAGFKPSVRLITDRLPSTQSAATRRVIYVHRCPVCQVVRKSRRPVTGWRCRNCFQAGLSGNLQITRTVLSR